MTRALRVLHVASGDLWAGAEVQVFTLISHLARMPEIEIAAVLLNNGMLADKLRSIGISIHVLDEQRTPSLGILVGLRRLLRSWRPDVVHTHRQKENILGSLANWSSVNAPSVRTVHGAPEVSGVTGWRAARSFTVRSFDRWCGRALQQRVIAVTHGVAAQMRLEFPAEKVAVIENGVDAEQVRGEKSIPEYRAREPNAIHIGIAGRLVEVKRVDLFIQTAALLLRENSQSNWRFHIFGDGPMRRRLEELAGALQLGDKITFHGHRNDIATCISGLDALVVCSDHEGMPMISLEAAALGVPTVAHAVGGLTEVVPEEFLVSLHDACGYRDGILRALEAHTRAIVASRMSESANLFSARRNAERVRALYEEVLAEWNRNSTERTRTD